MPKIKPVNKADKGHNRFCGPAALSIITGIDTAQAAAMLRKVSGKRSIMGATDSWMQSALRELGYSMQSCRHWGDSKTRPTLAAWLRDKTRGSDLFLVSAGHHWQVVQGRRYCCGIIQEVVSIRDERVKRRARVKEVFRITRTTSVKIEEVLPTKPKTSTDPWRIRTMRLANMHNIEIEVEGRGKDTRIVVWGPDWSDGRDSEDYDPYAGDHGAESWHHAHVMVEDYVELMQRKPHLFQRMAA